MHDPIVMEARAELTSAQSRIEQASSAHWPVVTATGSKLLSQSHRYSYDYDTEDIGNDSNLLIVFYVQIMPDDFVMQLHRF